MSTQIHQLEKIQNERILAALGAAAIAAGSSVVAYFDPSKVQLFPACPLYSLTGFACPGCGLTRGFHALFHGDLLTALHFNALIPVWAIIFCVVVISLMLSAVGGRGISFRTFSTKWLWSFLVLLLVFGVLRNLPVYPFSLLFP
jgi:hypothetical protein